MIHIAICDDNQSILKKLKNFIIEQDTKVYLFHSGQELLESEVVFDIVLLDIKMPDKNGLIVASQLYTRNPSTLLLFITDYIEYSMRGYEYRAYRYILKSEPDQFIRRNIYDAINECRNKNSYLITSYKREIAKISCIRIRYMESYGHTVVIHTLDGDYHSQEKLKDIYQFLKSRGFTQCHKSYIVNMRYIKAIDKNTCVVLDDHTKVPIGRKYGCDVVSNYLKFEDRRI